MVLGRRNVGDSSTDSWIIALSLRFFHIDARDWLVCHIVALIEYFAFGVPSQGGELLPARRT